MKKKSNEIIGEEFTFISINLSFDELDYAILSSIKENILLVSGNYKTYWK